MVIGGSFGPMGWQNFTELLKEDTLRDFYAIYPEKFNNETNGIIQRRWLQIADEPLSNEIDRLIGNGWRTDIREPQTFRLQR